ncbi:phosphoribosylaminoimidazolecarboxamide formyltransferase [Streptomyces rubradiris]|uniref:5-aminoimidazole-4-carboxamide ribonucleotide transformylase n=1 Tax=Streptomyces rubradiris TaxID=285531 RepID=A0ABQ3R468_STRRR|nr:phosphoribosylaminoimidazolecarboxamide formyltransferase [Streptomyces rubradiris]GHH05617.1 5-aminoimidazole-4-carboxamide ribonucleotide transformylase [Streptomyces rubradiris]GHI50656.1 5-aminoimidazole-4-carboxamide ribonucleotide transformylase [Streptomyces rubradiris]
MVGDPARWRLKYGLNPQQRDAVAQPSDGGPLPLSVLCGTPSVVNLLDALQGWQLVREASRALDLPAAASMKHVSPAGAAVAGEVDPVARATFRLGDAEVSGPASAYARARDCDPRSSYGDLVALSHPVDRDTAALLARVVSDGVIAPDFEPGVLEVLARKKRGAFLVLRVDPAYEPPARQVRDVFGVRITQEADPLVIGPGTLAEGTAGGTPPTRQQVRDAVLGLITVRYTQSNSVAYVHDGRTIGIGAGQQSRVDCVRLAGEKADRWRLRRHPLPAGARFPGSMTVQDRVNSVMRLIEGEPGSWSGADQADRQIAGLPAKPLDPAEKSAWLAGHTPCTLVSDAYLPFRDNVDVAAAHGVRCIVEGGGSARGQEVAAACEEHSITLVRTGLRLFCH